MTHGQIDILVVDDDISHCTILQALLRGWGYNVSLAYSGREALEQVREHVFDLVLCDVRMAEMDGIETLKEIKVLNPAIPILIMTAFSSVETAVEALKAGALDYLIKPLDFDRLQETLEKSLAHTRDTTVESLSAPASQFGMIGRMRLRWWHRRMPQCSFMETPGRGKNWLPVRCMPVAHVVINRW